MVRQLLAAGTVLVMLSACVSGQSSYQRTRAAPGELVWGFDNGAYYVTKDGERIPLSDVARAVDCVPTAAALAEDADTASAAGWSLFGIGLGAMVGGSTAGIVLLAEDSDENLGLGLGLVGGALVLGLILVGIGAGQTVKVLPNRIDAVNIYNDEYLGLPACGGRPAR